MANNEDCVSSGDSNHFLDSLNWKQIWHDRLVTFVMSINDLDWTGPQFGRDLRGHDARDVIRISSKGSMRPERLIRVYYTC